MATRYRVARKGAREWLDAAGRLTTQESAAAGFEFETTAILFLLEAMDDTSLWHVEQYRERCVLCGAAS